MPELPEVQTVVNYLNNHLINQKILDVNVYIPKILKNINVDEFKKSLIGFKIIKILRKGKYILLYLNNNKIWIVHLRMEGKFHIKSLNENYLLDKKHLVCEINYDNFSLCFFDTRRFATFHIINVEDLSTFETIAKISIDPLNELATPDYLYSKIHKLNSNIKTTLLNQSIISGIGNIYADEILFATKISPFRKAKDISLKECADIIQEAKKILNKAILLKGTTISSYSYDGEHTGGYQEYLQVHSNKIKKCKVCGHDIIFEKNNGRGTYWCKYCQK